MREATGADDYRVREIIGDWKEIASGRRDCGCAWPRHTITWPHWSV
jgi:hypothetical protein